MHICISNIVLEIFNWLIKGILFFADELYIFCCVNWYKWTKYDKHISEIFLCMVKYW